MVPAPLPVGQYSQVGAAAMATDAQRKAAAAAAEAAATTRCVAIYKLVTGASARKVGDQAIGLDTWLDGQKARVDILSTLIPSLFKGFGAGCALPGHNNFGHAMSKQDAEEYGCSAGICAATLRCDILHFFSRMQPTSLSASQNHTDSTHASKLAIRNIMTAGTAEAEALTTRIAHALGWKKGNLSDSVDSWMNHVILSAHSEVLHPVLCPNVQHGLASV